MTDKTVTVLEQASTSHAEESGNISPQGILHAGLPFCQVDLVTWTARRGCAARRPRLPPPPKAAVPGVPDLDLVCAILPRRGPASSHQSRASHPPQILKVRSPDHPSCISWSSTAPLGKCTRWVEIGPLHETAPLHGMARGKGSNCTRGGNRVVNSTAMLVIPCRVRPPCCQQPWKAPRVPPTNSTMIRSRP